MNEPLSAIDSPKRVYDNLAAFYDDHTRAWGYEYERWSSRLLEVAEAAGLEGDRLLDVGCGTGLSFIGLLERGFEVTACDVSPAMIEQARAKVGDRAELLVADMRELPRIGEFDLVWAVNEPLSYLRTREELEATLAGMRRNAGPRGVVLFDLLTLKITRALFTEESVHEEGGRRYLGRGEIATDEVVPDMIGRVRFEIEGEPGSTHVHRLRHFSEGEVLKAIEGAGLRCETVFGELEGGLYSGLDEEAHDMAVYVCRQF
jgi:ubiquinone/menaquinone biosynthesis C-methylase UbiE